MGMIGRVLTLLFGGERNRLRETVEVFRENEEAAATRTQALQMATLQAQKAEFAQPERGLFDRAMDGLNRLPRPALALGCLGLFVSAMVRPVWFSERMQGIALIPEPLWWLMGVIVSFYFGARHQAKGQEFQRSIAQSMARVPVVVDNIATLRALRGNDEAQAAAAPDGNAALEDWRREKANAATK